MNISNTKITLRAVEERDMVFCRDMINSSYIEMCTIGKSFPISEEQQLEWFRNYDRDTEIRVIIENSTGPIGMIIASGINWINRNCEVAIKISASDRIKPDDTMNACEMFLKYLFDEVNLNSVYAHILEENRLSRKLLEKLGFIQEGQLRQRVYKRGTYHDIAVFSLLKGELRED